MERNERKVSMHEHTDTYVFVSRCLLTTFRPPEGSRSDINFSKPVLLYACREVVVEVEVEVEIEIEAYALRLSKVSR